jgi:hypothetical protein
MKYDRPRDDFPERVRQERIQAVLDQTRHFWLENVSTVSYTLLWNQVLSCFQNTTLGEARGKLVLLRRFELENGPGFDVSHDWKNNDASFAIPLASGASARIEDYFLFKTNAGDTAHHLDEKWRVTAEHLQAARRDIPLGNQNIWITFTSAVGDKLQEGEDVTPLVSMSCFSVVFDFWLSRLLRSWPSEGARLKASISASFNGAEIIRMVTWG